MDAVTGLQPTQVVGHNMLHFGSMVDIEFKLFLVNDAFDTRYTKAEWLKEL